MDIEQTVFGYSGGKILFSYKLYNKFLSVSCVLKNMGNPKKERHANDSLKNMWSYRYDVILIVHTSTYFLERRKIIILVRFYIKGN